MTEMHDRHRRPWLLLVLAVPLGACATVGGAPPKVDLGPAREAVEAARQAGAAERAAEAFGRAQGHLNEAEALASSPGADKRRQAETLARVTIAEAQCSAAIARAGQQQSTVAATQSQEAEKLTVRLRKSEEDQRKAEEKAAGLQRELDLAETEVIRTKARLKGIETKAEASSAIAEARILTRRLGDEKGRAADLARCQQALAKAEDLLKQDNYGAAIFFAQKAQEIALKTREGGESRPPSLAEVEQPAPQRSYRVKAASANIRKGPSTSETVVGKAPKGAALEASVVRGDWVKVTYGELTGWVYRSLLE